MSLRRRDFLRRLLAGGSGLALAPELDWERLLWTPRTLITVPAIRCATLAELNEITRRMIYSGVVDQFFAASPLLEFLKTDGRYYHGPTHMPTPLTFSSGVPK